MTGVWVDANILIRFITKDEPGQAARARTVMQKAARGDVVLRIPSVVVAEVVWVLRSVYRYEAHAIAATLRDLALAEGVALDEPDVNLEAVRLMDEKHVAYTDAYLAARARHEQEPVLTFDSDFRRLGVELFAS